ncbi:unnamed protein product [Rotaria sp. Silwood1]|nr:unnamed protein product [Rotaria sp. Silwood1]CAF0843805.1 unnamed protein product [Rotaria sp. Silwood1]CAF0954997.1 unnamed protein product [Rotaria sp. Silwood1]CAF3369171.1 unnamed protein product [Rotaria sp. Silwood1]CAF3378598.1 unnamed protein product [Rotaria sp. Silwood1]
MPNKCRGIGIDLGTTYSASVFYDGKIEIIANKEGNQKTSSYVAFTDTKRLIGDAAKNQINSNPYNTVFNAQRLIGHKFDDSIIQSDINYYPFKVVNKDGKPNIQVEYKKETKLFTAEEILAMILSKMQEIAQAYIGKKLSEVVIGVPAYFNYSQRQAINNAGAIAGLNVLRIINGSTLAGMAYGFHNKVSKEQNVLIFDLGGGTCNVSVLIIEDGIYEVKSTTGDTHLGGEDFDNRMITYFLQEFKRKHNKDLSVDKRALRRLRTACESAKRTLSSSLQASIEIESLFDGIDFYSKITRTCFEELCADLFRATLGPVEKALRDAKMDKSQIHEIVLVGGSTHIPQVQKLLQDFFHEKELNKSINPDTAVAYGAAIQAALSTDDRSANIEEVLLLDVTSCSFDIEGPDGIMIPVIKRNTTTPIIQTHTLTTYADNQTSILIKVYDGERTMVKDNYLLGQFELSKIPPAPRGVPQIEVKFSMDDRGTLFVSAIDQSSGKENEIIIVNDQNSLSRDESELMTLDAKKLQKDNEISHKYNSVKQSFESDNFNTETTINNGKSIDKIDANERKIIMENIEEILKWTKINQYADKDVNECKLEKIGNICSSLLSKLSIGASAIPDGIHVDKRRCLRAIIEDDDKNNVK